jgi:uncharacterized protein
MKYANALREEALHFLKSKEIALAGASRNPKKFGNVVMKTLQSKGFKIYPLNPNANAIDNEMCYKSVKDLPDNIKNLLIVLSPPETEKVLREAIDKGIKNIWIQQGSENENVLKIAREENIKLISGKCVLMYANPTGFHKFHMRINKLFGKY